MVGLQEGGYLRVPGEMGVSDVVRLHLSWKPVRILNPFDFMP